MNIYKAELVAKISQFWQNVTTPRGTKPKEKRSERQHIKKKKSDSHTVVTVPTVHSITPAYIFLFRNISMLTCSRVRRKHSLVTVSPAAENTRSDGAEVAGMQRYCRANFDRNLLPFTFHQSAGLYSIKYFKTHSMQHNVLLIDNNIN